MSITEAIAIVRAHNAWRRGGEDSEMADPTVIGIALDVLCDQAETIRQLQAALNKVLAENLEMRPKPTHLDAVARQGSHAAIAR